jgi:hypothetical protein
MFLLKKKFFPWKQQKAGVFSLPFAVQASIRRIRFRPSFSPLLFGKMT